MICTLIKKLVKYGLKTELIAEEDVIYTTNRLLELFELDSLDDDGDFKRDVGLRLCSGDYQRGQHYIQRFI